MNPRVKSARKIVEGLSAIENTNQGSYLQFNQTFNAEEASHSLKFQIPTASRSSLCCDTDTKELATMAPLAATAGTPIPGKVESPQQNS